MAEELVTPYGISFVITVAKKCFAAAFLKSSRFMWERFMSFYCIKIVIIANCSYIHIAIIATLQA